MNLNDIRQTLAKKITALEEIAKKIEIPINSYDTLTKIINKSTFDIAVVGEFSAGKSTLINALLGIDLLPSLLEPTTARITYITYSDHPQIILKMKDGSHSVNAFNPSFLKTLVAENKDVVENIDYIEVMVDNPLLKDGIRLIDTPGTNDTDEQRVAVTYGLLPEADAVVYLTIHPVTASNIQVFKEHILNNKIKNLFFVLNKIDLINGQIELAVKDAKSWFIKECNQPITNFYPVSALDYLEGIESNDTDLINSSKFEPFLTSITNFLHSSEKYNNLQTQYSAIFENVKTQLIELLRIKIGGLLIPEESFKERKNILKEDLNGFKEQIKELEKQLDREFNALILKIEDSLNDLLTEIISQADDVFSRSSGDTQLILKDIELGIKYQYKTWRERNEPIINELINSFNEEVSLRTMHSIRGVEESIVRFTGSDLKIKNRTESNSYIDKVMSDDSKYGVHSVGAAVSTMILLHFTAFAAFAPVAFLIYPLASNYRKKWNQKQKEQMKPQIISSLQEGFDNFRKEMIHNIGNQKNNLNNQIDNALTDQTARIKNQLDEIEKERTEKKSEIEKRIADYKEALEEIRGL